MNNVTLVLTPIDADKFKLFQKYYDLFSTLEDKQILDMQFGKCIINVAFGEVQNIVKEEMVYRNNK